VAPIGTKALFAQAKGVKAATRAVICIDTHCTALWQAVHMTVVALKAALTKQALVAKAGFDRAQTSMWQSTATVIRRLMLAIEVRPTVVTVDPARLRRLMNLCASVAITVSVALAVLFDGFANDGDCCQTKKKLTHIVTIHALGMKGRRGGESEGNSSDPCDQWLKHICVLSVRVPSWVAMN